MLMRERAPVPSLLGSAEFDASLICPAACRAAPNSGAPFAPLPSLREALARRAEAFGPHGLDEPEAAPLGALARCAAALRGFADLLDPRVAPC